MEEKNFILDEISYEKYYKPVFRTDFNFKTAIQFSIILPFQIPYPDSSLVSFQEDISVLCYHFMHIEKEMEYTAGSLNGGTAINYFVTRVEMTFFTNQIYYIFSEDVLTNVFDKLLHGLNNFITAIMIKKKDIDLYKISKEMLEPSCLFRSLKLGVGIFEEGGLGLFTLHLNVAYKKSVLDLKYQNEIINYANVIKDNINPFILTEELMLNARRSFKQGFYKETILNAQTSVETFLRTLFSECLRIEGLTQEKIEAIQEGTNFITMVKREFSTRLGGSWDINNERKDVGNWFKNCYELRNKIIHAGYEPSFKEVDQGLGAALNLRIFAHDRLKKSKKYQSILEFL